ncbi:MAG: hypothetical protein BTN85_1292 [Candidatus Methanohalarchaeum thermophilum]|uniref:Essential protein Yae1 N-terminal domain-containing protein n=1 Tax=Methanohalarchaeum thermophilum TaxID=1903181 RepID=A0A1Q6DWP7_METT1|nr:MAG: hypothetical protein BTN85_1292 [Candidatus Methanohalarchaeum thermophilum]
MTYEKTDKEKEYDRKNPVVSFRVPREEKEKLMDYLNEIEKAKKEWIGEVIEKNVDAFEEGKELGYRQGKKEGKEEGYKEGYKEGKKEIKIETREKGYKNGFKEAVQEANKKTPNDTIIEVSGYNLRGQLEDPSVEVKDLEDLPETERKEELDDSKEELIPTSVYQEPISVYQEINELENQEENKKHWY